MEDLGEIKKLRNNKNMCYFKRPNLSYPTNVIWSYHVTLLRNPLRREFEIS